ncbi:copper chaperone PCu(A)C [Prosthecodimorpha staleyi]|uniref:Copper chaperone PCu(A)C n=1 Tax=Prosthecodimorpha staleyi TaxID=2840188 RepID=A0A947D1I2_9HYPH|nr:copper chaperone PCu(A)C [Prosthecodimorpha staleyi]MBT9289230.1 copper chaperone PCu(A)C [Prosthecodimorpha staleyi]
MTKSFLAVLIGATLFAAPAFAHDFKVGDLQIDHPWARATPGGATVGGGFMKIKNAGKASDRLVAGSAEVAGRVEIHEMAVIDGIMKMRALDKGLEIAPGKTVELKPGGYHVMLMELKRPLKQGETVKATLVFEKAGPVQVEFQVEAIGAQGSTEKHMGH